MPDQLNDPERWNLWNWPGDSDRFYGAPTMFSSSILSLREVNCGMRLELGAPNYRRHSSCFTKIARLGEWAKKPLFRSDVRTLGGDGAFLAGSAVAVLNVWVEE